MDVVVSRCAGIEIGKSEVVVCLRIPGSDGERLSEVRTFSAFAGDVEKLADWLAANAVSHVVMEATGQYWRPVWDVLAERGFELMLVNARHVKSSGALHPRDRLASTAQPNRLHRSRRRLVRPHNRQQHPPPRPPHHRAARHGLSRQPGEGCFLISVMKLLTRGGRRLR